MNTNFNGTSFANPARNTFSSAFDGSQPRQSSEMSLMTRRTTRAARRANRSL